MKLPLTALSLLTLLLTIADGSFAQRDYAKKILDTLCSPYFDGRGYVNSGDIRSADFVAAELQKIGAIPVPGYSWFQEYSFDINTFPGKMLVVMDDDTLVPGEEFLVEATSGSAKGSYELVELNSASITNGKIDMITDFFSRDKKVYLLNFTDVEDDEDRQQILNYAMRIVNFMPCIWIEKSEQIWSVDHYKTKYPLIMIDSAAYRPSKSIEIDIENKFITGYKTKNVIGYVPGKKKKKYVVFSAHLDHLGRMGSDTYFPGANDNASGVALLLSLAKYYRENPPEYSTVFCFFTGEEVGLEGSKYFVQHPYIKLKKVKFVLNIDIMGGASDGITVVNATEHPEAFNAMVKLNEEGKFLNEVKKRGPTQNSDHYFFTESGVPAFFIYSNGTVKNYHDVFDTAENTPLDKFDEVQALLIKFVQSL